MFSSRETKYFAVLLIVIIVLINAASLDAKSHTRSKTKNQDSKHRETKVSDKKKPPNRTVDVSKTTQKSWPGSVSKSPPKRDPPPVSTKPPKSDKGKDSILNFIKKEKLSGQTGSSSGSSPGGSNPSGTKPGTVSNGDKNHKAPPSGWQVFGGSSTGSSPGGSNPSGTKPGTVSNGDKNHKAPPPGWQVFGGSSTGSSPGGSNPSGTKPGTVSNGDKNHKAPPPGWQVFGGSSTGSSPGGSNPSGTKPGTVSNGDKNHKAPPPGWQVSGGTNHPNSPGSQTPGGLYPGVSPPHNDGPHVTVIHNHFNVQPVGSPKNPAGQPHPSSGPTGSIYVPGQTTIFLPSQQGSNGPGIGQLFKEALVSSLVDAGVKRIVNGAPHNQKHQQPAQSIVPTTPASSGSFPPTITNVVTYDNFEQTNSRGNVATAIPGPSVAKQPLLTNKNQSPDPDVSPSNTNFLAGTNPPDNTAQTINVEPTTLTTSDTNNQSPPSTYQYYISNEELWSLTETLFMNDEFNVNQYVTPNLQNGLFDPSATHDVSPAPLLYVQREAYTIPTIKILREVYENYKFDSNKKELVTEETRRKENMLLDIFLQTNIMTEAMTWLSEKGYIEPDSFGWKDTLRHMWMYKIDGATSGFERIFLAERYDGPFILGGQNWIYFNQEESKRHINYLAHVDKIYIGRKTHLVKIHFEIDGTVKPNSTMLIGTPPELEMALYTICYYARPNDACSVSLDGVKFNILTHAVRYFGKDLIDLGLLSF